MTEVVEQPITFHPLGASKRGDNTLYIGCDSNPGVSFRSSYAVCLNMIALRRADKRTNEDLCSRPIDKGECPALKMQREEEEAGHALYYLPRKPAAIPDRPEKSTFIDEADIKDWAAYARGWNAVGTSLNKTEGNKHIPVNQSRRTEFKPVKPVAAAVVPEFGIESMLNEMMQEHATGKEETITLAEFKRQRDQIQEIVKTDKAEAKRIYDRLMYFKTNNLIRG